MRNFRYHLISWLEAACVVAAVAGIVTGSIELARAQGRHRCHNWSLATRARTSYRIMSFGDTGKCFARLPDGMWLPTDRLHSQDVQVNEGH